MVDGAQFCNKRLGGLVVPILDRPKVHGHDTSINPVERVCLDLMRLQRKQSSFEQVVADRFQGWVLKKTDFLNKFSIETVARQKCERVCIYDKALVQRNLRCSSRCTCLSLQFFLLLNFLVLRARLLLLLWGVIWSSSCCWWLFRLLVPHQLLTWVNKTVLRVSDLVLAVADFGFFKIKSRCETLRFRNGIVFRLQIGVVEQLVRWVRDAQHFRAHWCKWLHADRRYQPTGVLDDGVHVELALADTSSLLLLQLTLFSLLKTQFERLMVCGCISD